MTVYFEIYDHYVERFGGKHFKADIKASDKIWQKKFHDMLCCSICAWEEDECGLKLIKNVGLLVDRKYFFLIKMRSVHFE